MAGRKADFPANDGAVWICVELRRDRVRSVSAACHLLAAELSRFSTHRQKSPAYERLRAMHRAAEGRRRRDAMYFAYLTERLSVARAFRAEHGIVAIVMPGLFKASGRHFEDRIYDREAHVFRGVLGVVRSTVSRRS
jgi:hypothetical protein